ncbi:hypothetical protein HCU74_08395 [Spongiibacter sp. KMU-166]|uniref:Uncharacterized protein n=1 Tax=Spongiibacter thalassae TaxID=2721624 RepID=A0ABX1GE20_9GAMM|nr:hypothetical protein [Spongiibacter thalassae]NKI17435.1 hypothetical protein [Spongiibacter thalassae]
MTESQSTLIAKAIERCLLHIAKDSGYLTDAGSSVHRGWFAHAIQSRSATFPLIAIQPDTQSVEKASGTGREFRIADSFRLVVATDDVAHPADLLKDCMRDVRRALALNWEAEITSIPGVRAPDIGTAEFALSADSPHTLAAMPVGITFTEKHEA